MGDEVLILMEKGEVKKVRQILEKTCDGTRPGYEKCETGEYSFMAPSIDGEPSTDGCWITFKGQLIEVGHQVFDLCDLWAMTIACGIRDRFKVKKGGWGCIGYDPWFMKTYPTRSKIMPIKRALKKGYYNTEESKKEAEDTIKEYRRIRKIYEKAVNNEIFKGVRKRK